MSAIISVQNITVKYGKNVILDGVSFDVEKGEYVGLIGPNGAGKTTLLKTILGTVKPTSGEVSVAPGSVIGYVPQQFLPSSLFSIAVWEIVGMGLDQKCAFVRSGGAAKIQNALSAVGLDASFADRDFTRLSGGQKQRVIIARSLVHDPDILLFDEPLSGIDHQTKVKIYELLARLNKDLGITIVFVSHEVEHVIKVCKRILCLDKHLHEGCHPMNFAEGERTGKDALFTDEVIPVHHSKQDTVKTGKHIRHV